MMKLFKLFILSLIIFLIKCNTYQIISEQEWQEDKEIIKTKIGNFSLKKFPAKDSLGAIVLFDPVFIRKENLYPSSNFPIIPSDKTYLSEYVIYKEVYFPSKKRGTLIPYLNRRGYTVYLISPESITNFSLKKSGTDALREVLVEIEKNESSIILGGVSLGGQAIAHYLSSGKISPKIQKVFFLGTGFDYKYSGSLVNQFEKVSKKDENYSCKISEKDNFCNRFVTSLAIEKNHPRRALTYPNVLPILEKDPSQFHEMTNQNLNILLVYGKLDGVSPEEAVLAPFFKGWGKDFSLSYFEASTASNLGHDYDHFDLFYHPHAQKEIYSVIANWIPKKN
jgi:hypothetical protein